MEEYTLLSDETERHDTCRKLRRARRNRKRYRKPRFNNRTGMICKDGFAPGVRNCRDRQIDIFVRYNEVMPITRAYFEMSEFDTQVLQAVEAGHPVPTGLDYQPGSQYSYNTFRAAVFARDGHTCQVCGKGVKDGAILRVHRLGYLTGDHTDRMSNLLIVCTKCHTPKNHKKGGKLYGLKPWMKPSKGATFMTAVRWDLIEKLKEATPRLAWSFISAMGRHQRSRKALGIKKTHANDAYAFGMFHPKWRADTRRWKKRRRNNRELEKSHDAKYVDLRDKSAKSGMQLSCGRTNRSESRHGVANRRKYRAMRTVGKAKKGFTVSKGRRSIRMQRYSIQPGDVVMYENKRAVASGTHNTGTAVMVNEKSVTASKLLRLRHAGGWIQTN